MTQVLLPGRPVGFGCTLCKHVRHSTAMRQRGYVTGLVALLWVASCAHVPTAPRSQPASVTSPGAAVPKSFAAPPSAFWDRIFEGFHFARQQAERSRAPSVAPSGVREVGGERVIYELTAAVRLHVPST